MSFPIVCLLLAGANVAQGVIQKATEAQSSVSISSKAEPISVGGLKVSTLKTSEAVEVNEQDLWHVHGKPGHQWRWVDTKDGWQRKDVDEHEAKLADAPGAADTDTHQQTRADPPAPADAAPSPSDASMLTAKVNIDVYYETRCPGCLLFINRTLEPLWRSKGMQDFMNVTLYTYGNSVTVPVKAVSEGYRFWHPDTTGPGWDTVQICQHGSDECLGNLVQLCVQDQGDHSKHMELVFCMAATTIAGMGEENSAYSCMVKAGVDTDKVKKCVQSTQGMKLAEEAGKLTNKLKDRLGTPWVMIAGEHAEDKLLMNTTLLQQAVCGHASNAPAPCSPWKGKDNDKAPAPAPAPAPGGDDGDFEVLTVDDFIKVSPDHV